MKQKFFDHLDGGWGDLIADTYEEANTFIPETFVNDYNKKQTEKYTNENINKILKIPNDVEHIGFEDFAHTTIIGELIIPDSVESIYSDAFKECEKLTNIKFSNNEKFNKISERCFMKCYGLKGTLEIPSNINYIKLSSFLNCNNINSIIFNEGLKDIYRNAFMNCTGLTGDIILPDSLKTLSCTAFEGCYNIDKIFISKNTKIYNIFNEEEMEQEIKNKLIYK